MLLSKLAHTPLHTRADLQNAVHALFDPLRPHFSPNCARVRLGDTGAHFTDAAAELEGFARPLWGLVPLAAGGGVFDGWHLYQSGLTSGSDPHSPEYWGEPGDGNQRLVEMAAIGLGLALVPQHLWEPLSSRAKQNLARWLRTINTYKTSDNNWHFFRVLVNMGLLHVDAEADLEAMRRSLDRIEDFYLADGWYNDGPAPRVQRDYYIPFAMHFYGLVYAKLMQQHDPDRAATYRERAAAFARDFIHWFAADGSALPFGRSLTYRFAQGSFWGALPFADVEALPWGVVKGLWLRHLRWWAQRPIANNDGTLSIGYSYPNLNMAEDYNSPGSPYWALKYFLPLALSEEHPFWQAEEQPQPDLPATHTQPHAGMTLCRDGDHVFALSCGQHALWARHGEAKYAKFAYSTAFGFSVPAGRRGLNQGAYDSTLALSEDGVHYRAHEQPIDARQEGETLYSRWQPWPDVEIETWLIPRLPWHIRIHRINTARRLISAEGGWAVDRTGDEPANDRGRIEPHTGHALAVYPAGWSGIRDLHGERKGEVVRVSPNTNLLSPRTYLPTLIGEHEPGEHWLMCAVIGRAHLDGWEDLWNAPPEIPVVAEQGMM
jgi:hypothetical protein